MSIYLKLASIQKNLVAPKGQYNDYGGYNYRSCEDILKALKPLCDEERCVLFINNTIESMNGKNYIGATVTLVDTETGEQISSTAHAREADTRKGMDDSQITGSSSSYARKYALAGLFCIDNEKDADATNTHGKRTIEEEGKRKAEVLKFINDNAPSKEYIEGICEHYKVKSLNDLTLEQCEDYINLLNKKGDKNNE